MSHNNLEPSPASLTGRTGRYFWHHSTHAFIWSCWCLWHTDTLLLVLSSDPADACDTQTHYYSCFHLILLMPVTHRHIITRAFIWSCWCLWHTDTLLLMLSSDPADACDTPTHYYSCFHLILLMPVTHRHIINTEIIHTVSCPIKSDTPKHFVLTSANMHWIQRNWPYVSLDGVIVTKFCTNSLYHLKGFLFLQYVVKLLAICAHDAYIMNYVHVLINKLTVLSKES